MMQWIIALRKEIEVALISNKVNDAGAALGSNKPAKIDPLNVQLDERFLAKLHYDNPACVECGMKKPDWASLNLCVLICVECSGVHRSLGSHISKVRGLQLDKWTLNSLKLFCEIGNSNANDIWEYRMFEVISGSLTWNSSRDQREEMIRRKVVLFNILRPIVFRSPFPEHLNPIFVVR